MFVFSCVFTLLGVLWLLNFIPDYKIELNAVSVVNLVLAAGLSVEFIVHFFIFYNKHKKGDTKDKIKYAMKNVGLSVLIGIVATKIIGKSFKKFLFKLILGVSVLFFAPSKIFQIYYFRMYFFLIIVGFFHGFILLPIFLSFLRINVSKKNKLENNNNNNNNGQNIEQEQAYQVLNEE